MQQNPPGSILLDRAAAAASPAEADARAFLATQRVFISSVMSDLREERAAAAAAIEEVGAEPVWFERFGGRDADPEDAYVAEVRTSTIYVGILGQRYGKQLPSRFSATHTEFNEAERSGLRISVWTISSEEWDGHQQSFVQEIRTFHTTGSFNHPGDLADGVAQRLIRIAAEELSPWCKLGSFVFRASQIRVMSGQIEITALIRDPQVADGLEEMRPDRWASSDYQFSDPSRSLRVRAQDVESVTTSARGRELTLRLVPTDGGHESMLDMSYSTGNQNYSPDDLTELALREHLFGERNPVDSSFLSLPDPLQALPSDLPEEILRPIVRLLLTEALVGSGRATRIRNLRVGVSVGGARSLMLELEGASRYANPAYTIDCGFRSLLNQR